MTDKRPVFSRIAGAIVLLLLTGTVVWFLTHGLPWAPRQGGWEQKGGQGLADFGTVPAFSLTERSGKSVTLRDLGGQVWVANFMYTSCEDTCPLQSAVLAKLQSQWGPHADLKVVSITVDPERDTPAVLSRYADRFGADPDRWFFLTGPKAAIYRLAQEGFHLSATPATGTQGGDGLEFVHSSRFVLVDGQARIRGYYQSDDPEALRQLSKDVKWLLTHEERRGKKIPA